MTPCHVGRRRFGNLAVLLVLGLAGALCPVARGQAIPQPVLTAIFPMGGKAGTNCDVTVAGYSMDGEQHLVFSHPGITASPLMLPADRFYPASRPAPDRFTVHIAGDVPVGVYEVRVSNPQGLSTARAFVVDRLPELRQEQPAYDANVSRRRGRNADYFAPSDPKPNCTAATAMPVAINSIVNGSCTTQLSDYYRFPAKKGQRVLIHCTAMLADSRTEPVLKLFDPDGNPMQEAHDSVLMDPTLDFSVPQDGDYLVSIHDFLFRGGAEFGYRLAITTGPWIDFVDPPIAAPGTDGLHTLYGRNLPGSEPAGVRGRDGHPLEKLVVTIHAPAEDAAPSTDTLLRPADGTIPTFSYRLETPGGVSNPVRMALSGGSLLSSEGSHETPDKAQTFTTPAQVVGTFHNRNQNDWYSFHAHKGEKLWMEVTSQRLGLPTDPYLLVQKEATGTAAKDATLDVTEGDDQTFRGQDGGDSRFRFPNDDPAVPFTAPADGNYRLLVRDLYSSGQAEPRFFYMLSVRPAQPDFRLQAYPSFPSINSNAAPYTTVLRKGGAVIVGVLAFRRDGFDGEIHLTAEGLPPGVTADPTVIGPSMALGNLVIRAAEDAADWSGNIRIFGRATINGAQVSHIALPAETQSSPVQGANTAPSRIIQQFALAVRGDARPPFAIQTELGKVYRVPRGGKFQIPLKISRDAAYKGLVQLAIVGLPQAVRIPQAQQIKVDGSEKTLDVEVDPIAAPGTFSFLLRGEGKLSYELNPGDAKLAADDKSRINAIADRDTLNLQKASEAHQQAEQAVQQMANLVSQLDQRQAGLQQLSVEAERQNTSAQKKIPDLQTAADAAQKSLDDAREGTDAKVIAQAEKAAAKAKTALDQAALLAADRKQKAQDAADAVSKAAADKVAAQKKSKTAEEDRTKAIDREIRAREDARVSEDMRRQVDEQTRQTIDAARPRDVRLLVASSPILVEVVDNPFTLALKNPSIEIKAGGPAASLPVSLTRDFGFDDAIRFDLQLADGSGGISIPEKQNSIAKGANDGALSFQAEAGAPAGTFTCKLHARYQLNNRELVLDLPLEVTVLPADKKK